MVTPIHCHIIVSHKLVFNQFTRDQLIKEIILIGYMVSIIIIIDPTLFNPNTYVSHIKTHHLGVIALPLNISPSHNNITRSIHTYRRRHPNQHKACVDYLSSSSFNLTYGNITESVDSFYTTVNSIFNKFYPLKQITIKSSDPPFINPFVKSLLCQKTVS